MWHVVTVSCDDPAKFGISQAWTTIRLAFAFRALYGKLPCDSLQPPFAQFSNVVAVELNVLVCLIST